ncbi:stalk domain-containing protein [Paenibacillus sp. OV219]|uniref:stalk domain-containing protein n=1 Tax=Paenibacillus sp. OV219 TaxID=1884377 RepID=UPI0008ADF4BA|nr:stalk domain-containing protein [Paenibacillus sp. OV219]SEO61397.1 Copper amine oxidase N-terminal domain-containing protein [Paenibacillus sp. OV219]
MKRLMGFVLALLVVLTMAAGTASAATQQTDIKVKLNGEWVIFPAPPVLLNSKTYVEFRTLFTKLGYKIDYTAATKTIKATSAVRSIQMQPTGTTALVDGKKVPVNGEMKLISGRTMVGVRFIATLSDKTVNWDGTKKLVTIADKGPTAAQKAEVVAVLNQLAAAEDKQDADAFMALIHSASPYRSDINDAIRGQFAHMHTKTEYDEITLESYSATEAVVSTVERTYKVSGDGFYPSTENEIVYTLRKDNGKWAIYDIEQMSAEVKDFDALWKQEITVADADKAAINTVLNAQTAATNAKDIAAYTATLVPDAEGFQDDVDSAKEMFEDTDTEVKMTLERSAVVEMHDTEALLLVSYKMDLTMEGESMPVRSVFIFHVQKQQDGKWLLMPGPEELSTEFLES